MGFLWLLVRLCVFVANERFLDVLFRDSKLAMLLSESLGNINCQTAMIAHISDSPANYMETLTTVQLASRIHRTRKKKSKVLTCDQVSVLSEVSWAMMINNHLLWVKCDPPLIDRLCLNLIDLECNV